jgi:hypothetical protein
MLTSARAPVAIAASSFTAWLRMRAPVAHMQAAGMVNDHLLNCFRYADIAKLGRRENKTPLS